MQLATIVERLRREGETDLTSAPDVEVRALAADARRVEPGTLFCCWRGTHADGHDFLPQAVRAGAVAALVERPVPDVHVPQIPVHRGRRAAAFAAAAFYRDPWATLTVVGVTGTNGKTTTAALLRHLLGRRGPAASIGTLGVVGPDGRPQPGSEGLTTPGPIEIAAWLARLRDDGVRGVGMEVSSHALDQDRVAAVRFDAVIFTNLSHDHLDYHGTFEAYRDAKLRLLGLRKPGAPAALNRDDPTWAQVRTDGAIGFAVRTEAEVRAVDVRVHPGGTDFRLRTPWGEADAHLPLLGEFNVANALGAVAALGALGWPLAELVDGLASAPQVPGRLERVPGPPDGPQVVIDYAHTPDALARVLRTLRPLVPGRLVVVFGAGGDRDRTKRPLMGRAVAEWADEAIVTSDNPRSEDPARIAAEIEAGMGAFPRRRILDRRAAIHAALASAGRGDLVLLAGKGHERVQIWGDEVRPFDEREVVAEFWRARAAHAVDA
jgi:UDP-N-acetylmuramoyl-L-alanyl-D-glutamate--2,6-diaminopimelate ligase